MANRLFTPSSKKIGIFSRSLKTINETSCHKEYSNQGWRRKNTYVEHVLFGGSQLEKQKRTVWPDPNLGCLGPKDLRLSLPGNVGLNESLNGTKNAEKPTEERLKQDKEFLEKDVRFWKSLLKTPTNHERQIEVLDQKAEAEQYETEQMQAIESSMLGKNSDMECVAQPCPDLLRRELAGLFTAVNLAEGPLTAITLCQKSKYDMTSWSPDVEEERDTLVEKFIQTAKDVCGELRKKGQWADFIEPTSGRAFYGVYTNQTFFETDERYRHLGFRILDLGCCKVISHVKWGSHVFVGSIFTSAPSDCEYLQQLLVQYNPKQSLLAAVCT